MATSAETRRYASLLFIGTLAVLFALQWGPGSRGCDAPRIEEREVVATVNGTPIPRLEFAREYVQQAEQFRRQGLPQELLKQLGVHKQVLDRMINTELLAQAAERRGLSASDQDLAKLYRESPVFQKDGKFDRDIFIRYVREVENTTEVMFEDKLRRQLAAQRLLQLVEASVVVSPDEVKSRYFREGDTADVTFVRFAPTMFADKVPPPTSAAMKTWLEANRQAVKDYYEKNTFTFFTPEQVKARQILLRTPPGASDADKAAVKARAEGLREQLTTGGRPFAEVARAESDDVETREKGGELGLVERLQLPSAFADVLFALQPGEVTVPVETPLGYFIGTVEEKKAPEQRPFEAVEAEIATQLYLKEAAQALARAEADRALAQVKAGKALADLYPASAQEGSFSSATTPEARVTGPFPVRGESIPQLGPAPAALSAIAAMSGPGPIDQLVEVSDAVAVVVVNTRGVPTDEAFAAERAQLTTQAIKARQFEVRESFIKSLRETGTVVTNDRSVDSVVNLDS